jgi:hypothetical protein
MKHHTVWEESGTQIKCPLLRDCRGGGYALKLEIVISIFGLAEKSQGKRNCISVYKAWHGGYIVRSSKPGNLGSPHS